MSGTNFLDITQLKSKPKQGILEISVFGRGFGECIIIGCGNGDYVVIDSFQNDETKRPIALDYLESIGVDPASAIRRVVITHWHSDHIGMIAELIKVANSAQIVINPLFRSKKFLQYIFEGKAEEQESTKEFSKVLELVRGNRRALRIAINGREIYGSDKLQITALSPQDGEVINKYLPFLNGEENKTRREYRSDNLLSLVLLVKQKNGDGVLLGSDMEVVKDADIGWNGVLSNYSCANGKSSVFKIPHHGSITGHKQEIWDNLLQDCPISFITVYNKGYKLPTDDDISRINSLSGETYLVGNKNKRDKQMMLTVHKVCPEKEIEKVSTEIGLVRYRKPLDVESSKPVIECFGAAKKIYPSV